MQTSRRLLTLGIILGIGLAAGCQGGPSGKDAKGRSYEIKGKVTAVDLKKPAVTLDHQDIPGLMKAMQMECRVEDARLLDGIKPGDEVKGELVKEDSGPVITRLQKTVREP